MEKKRSEDKKNKIRNEGIRKSESSTGSGRRNKEEGRKEREIEGETEREGKEKK